MDIACLASYNEQDKNELGLAKSVLLLNFLKASSLTRCSLLTSLLCLLAPLTT